jgi:hypothetical protein
VTAIAAAIRATRVIMAVFKISSPSARRRASAGVPIRARRRCGPLRAHVDRDFRPHYYSGTVKGRRVRKG